MSDTQQSLSPTAIDTPPGWIHQPVDTGTQIKFEYLPYYTPLSVRPQAWTPCSGLDHDSSQFSTPPTLTTGVTKSRHGEYMLSEDYGPDTTNDVDELNDYFQYAFERVLERKQRYAITPCFKSPRRHYYSLRNRYQHRYDRYWDFITDVVEKPDEMDGIGPKLRKYILYTQKSTLPQWLTHVTLATCNDCHTGWWQFIPDGETVNTLQTWKGMHCPYCYTGDIDASQIHHRAIPLEAFETDPDDFTAKPVCTHTHPL